MREDRPSDIERAVSLQDLMVCHLGCLYNSDAPAQFRSQNVITSTKNFEIDFLPLKDKNLESYTNIEKALVLINFVLFAVVYMQDMDHEVKKTVVFIMSAILYFVATNVCLTGAAQIKGLFKVDPKFASENDESKSMAKFNLSNLVQQHSKGVTNTKKPTTKKVPVPPLKLEKKELQHTPTAQSVKRTRQKPNSISKVLDLLSDFATFSFHYGQIPVRLSFFTLNLVMLWYCIVNVE